MLKKWFSSKPVVAVIPISGVIGSGGSGSRRAGVTIENVEELFKKAFSASKVRAVVIEINSPGGSPVQSKMIADRLCHWAGKEKKPVYSFCLDVAASGGYWIACAGDEIHASPASIVGSIGVVSAGFGFPALLKKIGVERRIHTAGKSKAMLDPFSPELPNHVAHLKGLQEDLHEQFCEWIRQRRGKKIDKKKEKELFSGKFWSGRKAVELGLIDGEGDMEEIMRKKLGPKTVFRRFSPRKKGLFALLTQTRGYDDLFDTLHEEMAFQRLGLKR